MKFYFYRVLISNKIWKTVSTENEAIAARDKIVAAGDSNVRIQPIEVSS